MKTGGLLHRIVTHPSGGFFLAASALISLLALSSHLWPGGDDAVNLLVIKSYVHGHGFRILPRPAAPEYLNDRFYLITLSLFYRLFGDNYYALKLLSALAAVVSVWLTFRFAQLAFPERSRALMATALVMLASPLLLYLDLLIPETLFLAVTLAFCWFGQRYLAGGRFIDGNLLIFGLLALYLKKLGNMSLIFFIAFALLTPYGNRTRFKWMFLPLLTLVMVAFGFRYLWDNVIYYGQVGGYDLPVRGRALAAYICKYIPGQIFSPFTGLSYRDMANRPLLYAGYALGGLVTAITAVGLWRLRRQLPLPVMGTAICFLVLVEWHILEGGRFLFPILPFLTIGFVAGMTAAPRRMATTLAWLLLAALLGYATVGAARQIWLARSGYVEPAYRSYTEAVTWLAAHARGNGAVVAVRKFHPALYGHPVVRSTEVQTPWELAANAPDVPYLVSDVFREEQTAIARKLIPLSGRYREVYRTAPPVVIIYERIDAPPRPMVY